MTDEKILNPNYKPTHITSKDGKILYTLKPNEKIYYTDDKEVFILDEDQLEFRES